MQLRERFRGCGLLPRCGPRLLAVPYPSAGTECSYDEVTGTALLRHTAEEGVGGLSRIAARAVLGLQLPQPLTLLRLGTLFLTRGLTGGSYEL